MIPHLPSHVLEHVSLSQNTYYKMGGQARYWSTPKNHSEVAESLAFARSQDLPIAVLGSGSNSLFADGLFDGMVLSLENMRHWDWEGDDILWAEAGVTNTELAEIALAAGREGLSWMALMPGQLGASVRMNVKYFEGEMSQVLIEAVTMDIWGGLHTRSAKDIFLGYKRTRLMDTPEIVLGARLRLGNLTCPSRLLDRMLEVARDRHGKHHFDAPSCGSTFKNNRLAGAPSGQIFDRAGMRGKRVGDMGVSPHHANFVFNHGAGTTQDFLALTHEMQKAGEALCGVRLDYEVQPMGCFPSEVSEACGFERLAPVFQAPEGSWNGLLWHPWAPWNAPWPLPRTLLDLTPKSWGGDQSSLGLGVKVEQLLTLHDARQNPELPFLRWTTYQKPHALHPLSHHFWKRPRCAPGFVDRLWDFSVTELFIGGIHSGKYLELEMTPWGHWVALRFDAPRKRSPENPFPRAELWQGQFRFERSSESVLAEIPWKLLEPLCNSENRIKIQCAFSFGEGRYALAPHNARSLPPDTLAADFHRPEMWFEVDLEPDRVTWIAH